MRKCISVMALAGLSALALVQHPSIDDLAYAQSLETAQVQSFHNAPYMFSDDPLSLESRLVIPAIGVDAQIVSVGLTQNRTMETPPDYWTVGWYKHGAKPGNAGNSVITGHVTSRRGPAIFWNLNKLKPDDLIYVIEDGNEMSFVVAEVQSYNAKKAPIDQIFGATREHNLNLLTCTGGYDPRTQGYADRLVVYARHIE
ncbi:class F sortase [Candidatus Woesearchaeota archaeon]|nr:class F sortase [Candidatus Woesearchaeota archaeon]